MTKKFYSNGKLLITGEYVVLDGAHALAIPTKYGQDLVVEEGINRQIKWTSFDFDGSIWFENVFTFDEISNPDYIQKTDSVRSTLLEILREAYLASPKFINESDGYTIKTHLTFPKFWGLGTSSTLINNIAQWLQIDAFQLLNNSFGGSGYDIACAQNDTPVLYRLEYGKPVVEIINYKPMFSDNLYFVYLNRKQSSKAAIRSYYKNKNEDLAHTLSQIDKITNKIIEASNLQTFGRLIENHEAILSEVLEMKTVKETFFADFNGSIKSLGGWGGDFILVAANENPTSYFTHLGFKTVIPYNEMAL